MAETPTIPQKYQNLKTQLANLISKETTTKEDKSNKVTSWSSTTTDTHYPSEKLVKDSLDGKIDTNLTNATATGNNDKILCKTYDDGKIHTTTSIQANWVKDLIAHVGSGGIGSASGDGQSSINTKINDALVNLTANKEDNIYRIVGTEVSSPSSASARLHCGTLPFDSISGKIFVYVVPDISTLSTSQKALIYGSYPSGSTISYNIFKSNNEYLTIGDIQTGDELLLMDEGDVRLISNSSISGKEDSSNKVSSWSSTTNNIRYPTEKLVKDSLDGKSDNGHTHPQYLTSHQDITGKEDKSNKVTSISSSSTDTQYPSAKCVFDKLNGYLTSNEEVIFVNGTNQSTDTTTNTFTGTTSKLDSINSVVDGTKLIYKVSVTSTNDTNDLRLSLGTNSGVVERYIKSDNTYTTANLYPTYTLLFLVFFNSAWHIIGQSNPKLKNRIVDLIYPIGSIYMSVNNVSPQTLFGGSWEQIQDRFLLASGSTYGAGSTGGSADAIVVSHSHEPSNTDYNFLASQGNIAVNSTKRAFPSANSSGHYFVYQDGSSGSVQGINEYTNTNSVGSSGTGKNMPPYLAVYVWKRIA